MANGSISFVFDRNDGGGPVFATYEVEAGAVDRILIAHAALFGPVPVDPKEPESPARPMRQMTGSEIVQRWADECIKRAIELVHSHERSAAAAAASDAVEPIKVV